MLVDRKELIVREIEELEERYLLLVTKIISYCVSAQKNVDYFFKQCVV